MKGVVSERFPTSGNDMSCWLIKEHENNCLFVMPEVVVGHPCALKVDSRLQTAGMTDFRTYFRVNDSLLIFFNSLWRDAI